MDKNIENKIKPNGTVKPKFPSKRKLLQINDVNQPALDALKEKLLLKSYSRNTQRTYYYEFAQMLYILKNHPVNELTPERLKDYFLYCVEKLQMTESQMQSRINAVKFYFEQVPGREKMFFDIPRPKMRQQLPKHISQRDVKKNIFHTYKPETQPDAQAQLWYGNAGFGNRKPENRRH